MALELESINMDQIDCSNVQQLVATIPLVRACDVVKDGTLRLLTPFQYPNGEQIDLFIQQRQPLLGEFALTDLGQTTGYLLDAQVKPWATNKRRQIIEDICRALEVTWNGGQFEVILNFEDLTDLSRSMLRLAQACIRVSDLAFSARLWSAGSFKEELEEFLESTAHRRYETDVTEIGRSGEPVKLDFRIHGETSVSLVLTLSSASTVSAHNASNEALSRWYDLGRKRPNQQRLTVVDESHDVFKERDVARVGELSSVIWFPSELEQLRTTIST
jgi:hypothetical protein